MKKTITAHVLIKNEDRFIWYAIMSVINYVDKMIIFDTGSTDNTVAIVQNIISSSEEYKKKIIFKELGEATRQQIGQYRQKMIEMTDTDYFFILDGDEIWWNSSIEELVSIAQEENVDLVATHYINVARDIRHYRNPGRDVFPFLDKDEAATIRLYSMKIPGIHCGGIYGVEGFFDEDNNEVQCGIYNIKWQEQKYFHTSYIRRSSNQMADMNVFSRVKKLFPAYDGTFEKTYQYPECFYTDRPNIVQDALCPEKFGVRTIIYFILDDLKIRNIINIFRKNRYKKK